MIYDEFQLLWPPRPERAIPMALLGFYEKRGYVAQKKKNGTYTVIYQRGDEVLFRTRHPDVNEGQHKAWTPKKEHSDFFSRNDGKWNVYCSELLHSKVKDIRDQLFLFDVLVMDGVQLVGKTFMERQEMLKWRWAIPMKQEDDDQFRVGPNVSIAKNYTGGFSSLFGSLKPEDEGLVIKDPNAKLEPCFRALSNSTWQVKCRIPTKSYGFMFAFINILAGILCKGILWKALVLGSFISGMT